MAGHKRGNQAGLQALKAALALGASVELVIRTDRTEQVRYVSFHRGASAGRFTMRGDGDGDAFIVDGLVGSIREMVVRLYEGAPEFRVDNPRGNMGALFDGDEVVFNNIDIEVNNGTNA